MFSQFNPSLGPWALLITKALGQTREECQEILIEAAKEEPPGCSMLGVQGGVTP